MDWLRIIAFRESWENRRRNTAAALSFNATKRELATETMYDAKTHPAINTQRLEMALRRDFVVFSFACEKETAMNVYRYTLKGKIFW